MRPMLALPVGSTEEEVRQQREWQQRCHVLGSWPVVQRQIRLSLLTWLADACEGVSQWPGTDDELLVVPDQEWWRGSWARVRVSVEVLDGIP